MFLSLLRLLTVERTAEEGPPFLAAASGLAANGGNLFVVGDDENHLAILKPTGDVPGRLVRLFPGTLPRDHKKRKAAKPDLETLLSLPVTDSLPFGGLMALGSGSTPNRRRGVILRFDEAGKIQEPYIPDLTALYNVVDQSMPETNIEGAILRGDELILFNRGNRNHPNTTALAFKMASMETAVPIIKWRRDFVLADAQGLPLSITDTCLLEDGTILASAVAEDTSNAYDDGRLTAAAIVLFAPDLSILWIKMIEPAIKIEGIHGWFDGGTVRMFAVSDADDPEAAAGLYQGAF